MSDLNEVICGSRPLNANSLPPKTKVNDFDGDGATDLTVYWPQQSMWYIRQSTNLANRTIQWGWNGVRVVPGDYDGDDKTDVAVMTPHDGRWYVRESHTDYLSLKLWYFGSVVPVPTGADGNHPRPMWPCSGPPGQLVHRLHHPQQQHHHRRPVGAGVPSPRCPATMTGTAETDLRGVLAGRRLLVCPHELRHQPGPADDGKQAAAVGLECDSAGAGRL